VTGDEVTSLFPLPAGRVKCGLRTDLPKKRRHHDWVPLGTDTRNRGSQGFEDVEILACWECGTDKATETATAITTEGAS
jgi:hypothetical protein